jgi:hypothetical protein
MKRFKVQQAYLAFIMLILSVFLITGCGGHDGETNKWLSPNAPAVSSTVPIAVATGVCVNRTITATFSRAMLASTITAAGTFTVKETVTGNNVPGVVTYDAASLTATFTPTANLASGLNYTATITTAATDLAGIALAANKVWTFTVGTCLVAPAAPSVNLGSASTFGIAATAGVTDTNTAPTTVISGNVALGPTATCNAVTVGGLGDFGACGGPGFPPIITGYTVISPLNDPGVPASLATIKADLLAAFLSITPPAGPPAAGSLGGATNIPAGTTLGAPTGSALVPGDNLFTPGVYQSLTSILITGDLTLDAQGDPNARFVFQSSSTVGIAAAANYGVRSRILLVNGAKASNVWWQAGSAATLGTYSEFQGNILASANITMGTGATSCGRLFAGAFTAGAFVFDSNIVSVPGQPFVPPVAVPVFSATCE